MIGVCFHQIGHEVPPFLDNFQILQFAGSIVIGEFLKTKKRIGLIIKIDGIVRDSGSGVRLRQLRPDFIVPFFILGYTAGMSFPLLKQEV